MQVFILALPTCYDLLDVTRSYPGKDALVQTGCAPGAACCGCNQHEFNYHFSETIQTCMLRIYDHDPYETGVIKGGIESDCNPSKKTIIIYNILLILHYVWELLNKKLIHTYTRTHYYSQDDYWVKCVL